MEGLAGLRLTKRLPRLTCNPANGVPVRLQVCPAEPHGSINFVEYDRPVAHPRVDGPLCHLAQLRHFSFREKFLGTAGIIYRVLSLFALVVHVNRGIIISIGICARFLKSNNAESSSVFLRGRSWTIANIGSATRFACSFSPGRAKPIPLHHPGHRHPRAGLPQRHLGIKSDVVAHKCLSVQRHAWSRHPQCVFPRLRAVYLPCLSARCSNRSRRTIHTPALFRGQQHYPPPRPGPSPPTCFRFLSRTLPSQHFAGSRDGNGENLTFF